MRPKLRAPTTEEEAAIQRGIAADPDNPEWTEADFAAARRELGARGVRFVTETFDSGLC